ncbi:TolC family protein [Hydrogenobaculum acidophilum]
MRYRFLKYFFVLVAFKSAFSLTLSEAIKLAKSQNPSILKAKNNIKISKEKHYQSIASKFGEIDLTANTSKFNTPRLLIPFVPKLPLSPSSIPPSAYNITTASISYTLPIFTGFKLLKNIKITNLSKEISKDSYHLTKRQIIFNVYSIYLTGLTLKKELKAQEQRLKALKKLYDDVSLGVKIGKFAPVDLMKVQYELELTKASIKNIRERIKSTKGALNTLTGLSNTNWHFEKVSIKDKNFPPLDRLYEIAIKNRYELKLIKTQEQIAKEKLFIAKSSYLPNIYFNYTYQKIIGGGAEEPQWSYSLYANMPIFDFGKRYFDIISSNEEYLNTKQDYRQTILDIKKQVLDAYTKLKSAKANLLASEKAESYAEEVMRIEELKYKTGAGDMYDTLLAISNFFNSLANVYQNKYQVMLMEKYLEYTLGEKL